jgi:hypothetical protein
MVLTDDSRQSRSLRRIQEYEDLWNRLKLVTARRMERAPTETLLQSAEEFKIKNALILNLNILYDLHEFSGDNIFYCSLRGDTHPNAPGRDPLSKMRVIQKRPWDANYSRVPPSWMRSEYLKIRLTQYTEALKTCASFCFSEDGSLDVAGYSLVNNSSVRSLVRRPSISVSLDIKNHKGAIINDSPGFAFWCLEPVTIRPLFYTIEPVEGGVYPNDTFEFSIHYDTSSTVLPDEVWSLRTESGQSIPIMLKCKLQ